MTSHAGFRFGRVSLFFTLAVIACTSAIASCTSNESPNPRAQGGRGSADAESDPTAPAFDRSRSTSAFDNAKWGAPQGGREEEKPPPKPDLYDQATLPKFELTLDDQAMAILRATSREDKGTWVHGSFKFGSIVFADVGVRAKGGTTFRALPAKSSLKVKFNKWVKGHKLYGLEELTLNNNVVDRNFLRQRITYYVFNAMGLPASRANTAELAINGENYGLYSNVETPDENFMARALGPNATTLYEAHAPGTWLPGSDGRWEIDIPAAGAPAGTKPDLNLLFQAVASASDEDLLADLDSHLHTKQWLRFCATEALVGHTDGYGFSFWGSHNYYLAGDRDGKFKILPWSTDQALHDHPSTVDASKPSTEVVLARCARSTACWDAYKAEMRSVLAVYETLDLVNLAKQWHDQINVLAKSRPEA